MIFAARFYRQQTSRIRHHNQLMLNKIPYLLIIILLSFSSGCSWLYKGKSSTATLLKVEDSSKEQLFSEINRFAKVSSMRAKMTLQFEDTSFAKTGTKVTYIGVNGDVVVQRPANILLGVNVAGFDFAKMSSNGENFRVAILKDQSGGKFKKFIVGSNNADYSKLQSGLAENSLNEANNPSSFASLRPQHFTDALLIRPTDANYMYLQSTIFQNEEDLTQKKGSPLRMVMRGYYLLEEITKDETGDLKVLRRFWFDRVGGIRLSRQQLFDQKGEIESDIVYGKEGNLTANGEYKNLPLRIQVTRPKEKYTMSLTYQSPEAVTIGKTYPATAFVLKNEWNLEEVDLDKKLQDATGQQSARKNQ